MCADYTYKWRSSYGGDSARPRSDFIYTKNSARPRSDFIYTKNFARPRSDFIYTKKPARRRSHFIYTKNCRQCIYRGTMQQKIAIFWRIAPLWSPHRGILCVEKIRSRPRGILCVDKIGSVPQDRQSPGDHPFPLSKIDQWAILLRGNAAITFAITFFPSRFLRPGRSSCFAPHRHTRTVDH